MIEKRKKILTVLTLLFNSFSNLIFDIIASLILRHFMAADCGSKNRNNRGEMGTSKSIVPETTQRIKNKQLN
jgi:hypothetical protein